jgi:hypothetical protein
MSESERERQQREQAARILRKAMPDVSRVAQIISQSQINVPDLSRVYNQQYSELIERMSQTLRDAVMSEIELPKLKIDIPALKLDYSVLFPDLAATQKKLWETLRPSIDAIQWLQHDQFADIIKKVQAATRAALPPNWRDESISIPKDLEVLLLDEGLALAWVPPLKTIKRLFEAKTAQERRRILGRRWQSITRACIAELEGIDEPALAEYIEFALKAARTLLSGNHEPAQALSANLLDTMLRQNFNNKDRETITGRKTRLNIDDYPIRVAIVLGGIWGSFGQFWTNNGDPIPRKFTRHGSAHGVSRRQYSRINSLIALMHVVSLLKLLESDLAA